MLELLTNAKCIFNSFFSVQFSIYQGKDHNIDVIANS